MIRLRINVTPPRFITQARPWLCLRQSQQTDGKKLQKKRLTTVGMVKNETVDIKDIFYFVITQQNIV